MIEERYFDNEGYVVEYVRKRLPRGWTIERSDDEYAYWDAKITDGQRVRAVCEIKSRDKSKEWFEVRGSFLIDRFKYEKLKAEADRENAEGVVYNLTSDAYLFASRLSAAQFETYQCPRNSYSKDTLTEKQVVLLPLSQAKRLN